MQRFDAAKSEGHYKRTVHIAQAWKRRYEDGLQAGLATRLQQDLEARTN